MYANIEIVQRGPGRRFALEARKAVAGSAAKAVGRMPLATWRCRRVSQALLQPHRTARAQLRANIVLADASTRREAIGGGMSSFPAIPSPSRHSSHSLRGSRMLRPMNRFARWMSLVVDELHANVDAAIAVDPGTARKRSGCARVGRVFHFGRSSAAKWHDRQPDASSGAGPWSERIRRFANLSAQQEGPPPGSGPAPPGGHPCSFRLALSSRRPYGSGCACAWLWPPPCLGGLRLPPQLREGAVC